jgi:hypothetical protein
MQKTNKKVLLLGDSLLYPLGDFSVTGLYEITNLCIPGHTVADALMTSFKMHLSLQ